LQSEAYYLVKSVHHQLNLKPMWGDAVYKGLLAEGGQPIKGSAYEPLAKVLAEFKDD
jgi:hypothetical protein